MRNLHDGELIIRKGGYSAQHKPVTQQKEVAQVSLGRACPILGPIVSPKLMKIRCAGERLGIESPKHKLAPEVPQIQKAIAETNT